MADHMYPIDGFLYVQHFNEHNSIENLVSKKSAGCLGISGSFIINTFLQANLTYILVTANAVKSGLGKFSILVSGPNNVTFTHISKSNILLDIMIFVI